MKPIKLIKGISSFLLMLCTISQLMAQAEEVKEWTLDECIEYAYENNIQVQQNIINMRLSEQDVKASKYNVLPNLNGSAAHIYNFGQTIDPFTNTFATTQVRSNQLGLSSTVTLFDGFRNINNIKLSQAQMESSKYGVEAIKNDIALNIANAYLQILFNKELAKNASNQLEVTQIQVERIEKQVKAGALPEGNLQEIQSQLATEELQLVNAENQLRLSKINLTQLLNLTNHKNFDVVEPDLQNIEGNAELINPGVLYENAVDIMPEVKRAEYNYFAAEKSTSLARGSYYPTLNLTGSIGSGYSGANRIQTGEGTNIGFVPIGQVAGTGEQVVSLSERFVVNDDDFQTKNWDDQLQDNFNTSVGFRLNIPLFNGLASRTNVQKAKLNMESAQLDLENAKLQLRQNIETAHAEAVAALKRYKAAKKSVEALETSFDYTTQRFAVGLLNTFDFNNEKNRLNNARSELLQAKYEYIFRTKVLDFYRGQAISFNQ
jgi:outer membrane protein